MGPRHILSVYLKDKARLSSHPRVAVGDPADGQVFFGGGEQATDELGGGAVAGLGPLRGKAGQGSFAGFATLTATNLLS